MDKYEFNNAGNAIYSFTWNIFCDNYIEMAKFNMDSSSTASTLCYVLTGILKMLQPFMPFVTEELYSQLPVQDSEAIMISSYPIKNINHIYESEEKKIDSMIEFVTKVRTYRLENNIPKDAKVYLEGDKSLLDMLKIKEEQVVQEKIETSSFVQSGEYYIAFAFDNSKNMELEIQMLQKEIDRLQNSIQRRKNLLSNQNYVNKAPQELVEKEKETLKEEESALEVANKKLISLKIV
jgi:valyl-tRNA synthetase